MRACIATCLLFVPPLAAGNFIVEPRSDISTNVVIFGLHNVPKFGVFPKGIQLIGARA